MAKLQAKTPKGMRDFLPADMHRREYVFRTVREVFEAFGFEPISTPVMELRSTLSGSYGEEAEKLIYHAQHTQGKEELALRYDLTVPLSRFFAEHENELSLPFRRYHIAPVWRGERPGRGRYREFYQCDVDIVGLKDMSADAECVNIIYTVLTRLGFADFTIKMNNRKLLTGMGVYAGVPDNQLGSLYRSIDKTDKIGLEGVAEELRKSGIADEVVVKMVNLLQLQHDNPLTLLQMIRGELGNIAEAEAGLKELEDLIGYIQAFGVPADKYAIDLTMVRGLGYYTGPIFETIITKPENLGSVQGGGRYDNLIGMFRNQSLPTTGISLGIERIVDLMDQLNLYPANVSKTTVQVLVTLFDAQSLPETLKLASELRQGGLRVENYMDDRKAMGKQLGYADGKGIPVVAIMGPDELSQGVVNFKHLVTRQEVTVPRYQAVETVRNLLK